MLRLIDANVDRLGEGLRVLGEVARFLLDDAVLSRRLQALRRQVVKDIATLECDLLSARRALEDVGLLTRSPVTPKHKDLCALVTANSRRVQESLRVLEEFSRLPDSPLAGRADDFESLRFEVYDLERQLIGKIQRRDRAGRLKGLYLVLDIAALEGRDAMDVATAAIRGGVTTIQLRDKERGKAKILALAKKLKDLCSSKGVLFIINDHLDIAMLVRADGLHLGQDDLPLAEARRILPIDMLLGCSTHGVAEAVRARANGADYVALGSIFPTTSKEKYKLVGVETLRRTRTKISLPIVAIGGIKQTNIKEVMEAGADGVAVISAILGAADVEKATRKLVARMKRI